MVNETQFYFDIEEVTIYYKRVYFNAIDTIVACIQDQFNQTGFRASQNIEQLLLTKQCGTKQCVSSIWRRFKHNNINYSA